MYCLCPFMPWQHAVMFGLALFGKCASNPEKAFVHNVFPQVLETDPKRTFE